jgi:hypothetical protein
LNNLELFQRPVNRIADLLLWSLAPRNTCASLPDPPVKPSPP